MENILELTFFDLLEHLVKIFTAEAGLRLITLLRGVMAGCTGVIIVILEVAELLVSLQELILMIMMGKFATFFLSLVGIPATPLCLT